MITELSRLNKLTQTENWGGNRKGETLCSLWRRVIVFLTRSLDKQESLENREDERQTGNTLRVCHQLQQNVS
jgi:hypothetical protein